MKKRIMITWSLTLLCYVAWAQTVTRLEGRVWLNDTVAAPYATLYLPEYGIGTVTDDEGRYQMDNVPTGNGVKVEYAYLGYKTTQVKLSLPEPNHRYAHDQRLYEQPIELNEVYLTPKGEDPVTYICRKVHEQAAVNRKRLTSYRAEVDGYFRVRDFDIAAQLAPSAIVNMVRMAMKAAGQGALYDYVMENEAVDVHYAYTQTKEKGKIRNSPYRILSATPTLPDKAQRQLQTPGDLFELLYQEGLRFKVKSAVKDGWKLKGCIEEQGHIVDVLTRKVGDEKIYEEQKLYVIEDLWVILRYETKSLMGTERFECRDLGGGIYMPISYITQPQPLPIDEKMDELFLKLDSVRQATGAKNLEDVIETEAKGLKGKMAGKMIKNMLKRYEKMRQNGRKIRPGYDCPFTIKYAPQPQ